MWFFNNRTDAGIKLAAALSDYQIHPNTVVLGLPRGGIPIAYEVANALKLPLDAMLVRKLGAPGQEELAMGAIALGGVCILNDEVITGLHISDAAIEIELTKEKAELERRNKLYRSNKPALNLQDKIIILVDDGIATGATMRAAIQAIKQLGCKELIVAIPVAPIITMHALKTIAEEVICLHTPEPFYAIGNYYQDFSQVSSTEVCRLLEQENS